MKARRQNGKLLIISRSAPPLISGSSVVVENIIKGFQPEEVLVLSEKFLNIKNGYDFKYRNRIKYISFAFKVNWFGSEYFRKIQIPTGLIFLIYYAYRFRPNKILIIYPSAEYLFIGYLLSKLYKCDYFSYFHNTYLENSKENRRENAQRLQSKIFSLSKIVFLISDGMLQFFKRMYPDDIKFKTLPHSFSEEIPIDINVNIEGDAKLTMIGNINESCKDSAERMITTLSKIDNITFNIFTNISCEYFIKLGIKRDSLVCISSLDRYSFINKIREGDIMLFPHGFSGGLAQIEYETIFPTKTIEYLISGKPILYHGPRNAYITGFLRENDCALIVDEIDEKSINDGLNSLLENKPLRERFTRNALIVAERFHNENVINEFKRQIKFGGL